MTKSRIALFGSVMVGAVLLCGAGVRAQDYNYSNGPYNDAGYAPGNFDRSYDDRAGAAVTVSPVVQEHQGRDNKAQRPDTHPDRVAALAVDSVCRFFSSDRRSNVAAPASCWLNCSGANR